MVPDRLPKSRKIPTRKIFPLFVAGRHALVNAAFCVGTDVDGVVRAARFVFGCVDKHPVRATDAEQVNKNITRERPIGTKVKRG